MITFKLNKLFETKLIVEVYNYPYFREKINSYTNEKSERRNKNFEEFLNFGYDWRLNIDHKSSFYETF